MDGKILTENIRVSPNPVVQGRTTTLLGNAIYADLAVPISDLSVAGATVTFSVYDEGTVINSFGGYTYSEGNLYIPFPAPDKVGTYTIQGTVTDHTLTASFTTTFTVIPEPIPAPPSGCSNPCLNVSMSAPSGGRITVTISNTGSEASPAGIKLAYYDGVKHDTIHNIPSIPANGTRTEIINVYVDDIAFIQSFWVRVDPFGISPQCYRARCDKYDSKTVGRAADLTGSIGGNKHTIRCSPTPLTFSFYNGGFDAATPSTAKIVGRLEGAVVFEESFNVPALSPRQSSSVSYTPTYDVEGTYEITLIVDSNGLVEESNTENNTITRTIEVVPCLPDLTFTNTNISYCNSVTLNEEGQVVVSVAILNDGDSDAVGDLSLIHI